jgi:hypothetical protein
MSKDENMNDRKKRFPPKEHLLAFKHALILVGGIKGGTGKSTYAKVLIEYLNHRKTKFVVAECDRDASDVAWSYESLVSELVFAYFSEDPTKKIKADPLFNHAAQGVVVANLPAQGPQSLYSWFVEDRLYETANEIGIQVIHFYVSNGGFASVKLFLQTLHNLGPYMRHVLVRNHGLCEDWSPLDENQELQAAMAKYNVQVIDLPKVPHRENYFLDERQLAFSQGLEHPDLSIPERGRLNQFLRQAFEQIRTLDSSDG